MRFLPFVSSFVRNKARHLSRQSAHFRYFHAAVGPLGAATIGKAWYLWPAGIAVLLGAASQKGDKAETTTTSLKSLLNEPCVKALLQREGVKVVLAPGAMLRRHGVAGRLIAQDYWFDGLEGEQMVKEMVCMYDKKVQRFYCAVRVGRDVCGYPRTVHGGLTAAIVDETFGGLYVCLWTSGVLGFITPGLTARLEIDYRKKLAADTIILCTTEVESIEGRKVWMRGTVYDGASGVACATSRALFVAPRWGNVLRGLFGIRGGAGARRAEQQLSADVSTRAAPSELQQGGSAP